MLVISRFRASEAGQADLRDALEGALALLARQPGFRDGRIGRNVDDPDLWVLETTWEGPGAYRRALSAYDVKLHAWETLGGAIDEPSAYELVEPGAELNLATPRELGRGSVDDGWRAPSRPDATVRPDRRRPPAPPG